MKHVTDKKIVFVIQPQSIIDIITNSSSELFIFKGKDKEVIEKMISELYPNYKNEYEELQPLRSLSTEELDNFVSWTTGSHCWPADKKDYQIPGIFTFEELYEAEDEKPAWNGEIQYKLKKNFVDPESKWDYSFVTEENKDWVLSKLDPTNSMFLLYSIDENPNYDMQGELESIGTRYHLG